MMLLTCATHLMSVTIVRNYWKFPFLALLRVIIITSVFTVTGLLMTNQNSNAIMAFPTSIPDATETRSLLFLPAACFQAGENTALETFNEVTSSARTFFKDNLARSTPRNKVQGWNLYIITMLFYGAAIIAEVVRFFRRGKTRPGWRSHVGSKFQKCCGLGTLARRLLQYIYSAYLVLGWILSCAVAVISTRYIFQLRKWVDRSGWILLVNNQNPENDAKSFSQLVPILSSVLIVFSFAQIISEKCTNHNNRTHAGDEMPTQAGKVEYLGPSRYDMVPQSPQQVGRDGRLPWGHSPNSSGVQIVTPLLSGNTYSATTKAFHYNVSPERPAFPSPPFQSQGQTRDISPASSCNVIGSSHPSSELLPRRLDEPENSRGLWVRRS
ncbi:uncharacterized protein F4812DRAFT_415549 [Daldinia caldariorum]|uniref:uncharacterized protein n=1 Tax=Daldinia caldariorum TaxID=326644 RepID=UPI002007597A|nr:uncharacterized protein F4812DRAFT_415549 [Daldinia caldariorum]KAI1471806.1 hypothetical protein F4812DRAFT_415549 [Daldinia caldariorum]